MVKIILKIEIQATADCFGVNISIYSNEKWVKYSCTSTLLSIEGIYVKQSQNEHFETVVCVQDSDKQSCFGLCKNGHGIFMGVNDAVLTEFNKADTE